MYQLNVRGRLWPIDKPKVMGILNITSDSFFDGGKYTSHILIHRQVEKMLDEGADIIDIGAMSSRPFSQALSAEEEFVRLQQVLPELMRDFPDAIFSIDTYRSQVAEYALGEGVAIINDITAGQKDERIYEVARKYGAPYIAMHMQGTPNTMQVNPSYENVIHDILYFFSQQLYKMRKIGLADIIIDVGFGFGKSLSDNFRLLKHLAIFQELRCPILTGISRKRMIYKTLDTSPQEALIGSAALHFEALRNGTHILRVHDVKEAREVIQLYLEYQKV